jgi:hypothetical protein
MHAGIVVLVKANFENNCTSFPPLQMVSLYRLRDPKGEYIFGEKTSSLNKSQLAASMTVNNVNERTKISYSITASSCRE